VTDPLQDPGVQGLAKLGRNAIERVAQLEASNVELTAAIAMIARAIDVDERVQIGDLLSRLHALLAANRDLRLHFDALKADYDVAVAHNDTLTCERDDLKLRAEQAEAQLAEIETAPVIARLSTDCIGERYLCFSKPLDADPVVELIARPAKEAM
jgi:hypothetical protein